jgi:cytochrome b pre-mRNA-processing protein 3
MAFFGLTRNPREERAGFALYGAAVAAARDPYLYETLFVPDTLDGRFDLVGIHAFLVIRRLDPIASRKSRLVAQAVFDAMFSDMDINLREIGVGDLAVSKRVRAMWEAFHGRSNAYATALADPDPTTLETALARNVWRGEPTTTAPQLALIIRARDAALAAQPADSILAGTAHFPQAEPQP